MKQWIKKLGTFLMVIVMMMGVAVVFSGCEETESTLEDIAASDSDLIESITDKMETPEGTSVAVTFSGDSFDVTFTFDDVIDEDLVKPLVSAFDKNEEDLKAACESAIEDLQTQTGITGIVGTLKIENANGDELWSRTYPEQ